SLPDQQTAPTDRLPLNGTFHMSTASIKVAPFCLAEARPNSLGCFWERRPLALVDFNKPCFPLCRIIRPLTMPCIGITLIFRIAARNTPMRWLRSQEVDFPLLWREATR